MRLVLERTVSLSKKTKPQAERGVVGPNLKVLYTGPNSTVPYTKPSVLSTKTSVLPTTSGVLPTAFSMLSIKLGC